MIYVVGTGFLIGIIYFLSAYDMAVTGLPNRFLENLSLIPMTFVFFFIYLYFEALATARPPLKRIVTLSGILLFITTLHILNTLNLFTFPHFFPLFASFTYCFGMMICAFGVSIFKKAHTSYHKTAIRIDIGVFYTTLISTIILQISGISQFLSGEVLNDWAILLFFVGNVIFIGAMGLLVINSLINGDYIYYIPHPIQAILLYNEGGIPVFVQTFESGDQKLLKGPELISSALTAFSSFFKEILGTESTFNYINAKHYEFYFEQLPDNAGTLVVVASSANLILLRSVKKLVQSLPNNLVESIKDFKGRMLIEEFDKLIKVHFPYLNPLSTTK